MERQIDGSVQGQETIICRMSGVGWILSVTVKVNYSLNWLAPQEMYQLPNKKSRDWVAAGLAFRMAMFIKGQTASVFMFCHPPQLLSSLGYFSSWVPNGYSGPRLHMPTAISRQKEEINPVLCLILGLRKTFPGSSVAFSQVIVQTLIGLTAMVSHHLQTNDLAKGMR